MNWHTADKYEYDLLKEKARNNRNNQTEAETIFWSIAKADGLGKKCRRQYIICDYIVDFFFRKSKVIVEIDGGYHNSEEQQKADTLRQCCLEQKGYKVIRIRNEEILFNIENVIKEVKSNLINCKK